MKSMPTSTENVQNIRFTNIDSSLNICEHASRSTPHATIVRVAKESELHEKTHGLNPAHGRIKGGQRGQLPRAPRCKGAPRDEIYLFQIKYSVEKFS